MRNHVAIYTVLYLHILYSYNNLQTFLWQGNIHVKKKVWETQLKKDEEVVPPTVSGYPLNAEIQLANRTSVSLRCCLYDTRVWEVGLMCTLHILIMNSETIRASHSGLVRQELQGSPIHDQLIGKPGFITRPRFHTFFIIRDIFCTWHIETHLPQIPADCRRAKWQSNTSQEEGRVVCLFVCIIQSWSTQVS